MSERGPNNLEETISKQNKVIEIKLNEYDPINDNICIDSIDQDHV